LVREANVTQHIRSDLKKLDQIPNFANQHTEDVMRTHGPYKFSDQEAPELKDLP